LPKSSQTASYLSRVDLALDAVAKFRAAAMISSGSEGSADGGTGTMSSVKS
jgi:hypothetical protein